MLRLYTKEYGGVTVAAKGVRLEKSKLRGAIDLFFRSRIGFILGKEVSRLTHAELLDGYPRVREDAARYRAMGRVAELIHCLVADGEADTALWNLLHNAVTVLNEDGFEESRLRAYVLTFEVLFFKQQGYVPGVLPPTVQRVVSSDVLSFREELSPKDTYELLSFLQPLRQYVSLRSPFPL